MTTKKPAILLLTGLLMLPNPASAALERLFLYFPAAPLVGTPAQLGLPYEEVEFNAAGSSRLYGWYLPGEEGKPLVLFCHGNAGNISHRLDNLRLLHELGLTVFIFDYRGYGRSKGQTTEQGTYADARGALSWLRGRGWEPAQMIYFGRSLGAGVALQLALDEPPAALVLESTFTSITDMGKEHYPILFRLFGWALEARYDNLAKIDRLKTPLLLFHGEADRIVPLRMGQKLFERAPEPKQFYPIPFAGHNDTYQKGNHPYWDIWRELIIRLTTGDLYGSEPAR